MSRSILVGTIACVGVVISGCASSVEVELSSVTEAEAIEVVAATLFATFNSTSVLPPRPASLPAGDDVPGWMTSFEAEVRCPGGGRVGMAASVIVLTDPASGGGEAEYRLGQIHDDCRVQPGGSPRFEISGRPRLEADVRALHDGAGRVEWGGTAAGHIDWSAAGRRGSCEIDVRFAGEAEGLGRTSATVTGAVCGHTIESVVAIR